MKFTKSILIFLVIGLFLNFANGFFLGNLTKKITNVIRLSKETYESSKNSEIQSNIFENEINNQYPDTPLNTYNNEITKNTEPIKLSPEIVRMFSKQKVNAYENNIDSNEKSMPNKKYFRNIKRKYKR